MVIVRLTRKEAGKLPLSARIPRKKNIIVEGRGLGYRWFGSRSDDEERLIDSMLPDNGENWRIDWGWGMFDGLSYARQVKKGSVDEIVLGAVLRNEDLVWYIGEFFNDIFVEERGDSM